MSRPIFTALMIMILITGCTPSVPQEDFNLQVEEYQQLEDQYQQLFEENETLRETSATVDDELATVQLEMEELKDDYDELQAGFRSAQSSISRLNEELELHECEETLTGMQYKDILDISAKLQAWVTNQPWASRAVLSMRDSIWDNTDTKLHGITYVASDDNERYITWFLVYFDEFGWDEGVFWLGEQCWLERK